MSWAKILIIFRKEMLDLFRDRRTIITSIILPIILYPFISIFVATIASRQESKIEEAAKIVFVYDQVKNKESGILIKAIKENENLKVQTDILNGWNKHYKVLLENNDVQAFLTIRDTMASNYDKLIITAYYNNTDEKSQKTFYDLRAIIDDTNWEIVSGRLDDINISSDILSALEVQSSNVAPPQQILGALLGKFLAYMLIVLTISSGAVVASDLVAGEKERGTLETILVSAASRLELVGGKFLTIITFSFITVFMNLLSMYISTRHILGMAEVDMSQVQLPVISFLLIFFAMVPLAILFASIQLSLSTYSRNVKECSSYQTPLLIIGMMFSMISVFPGFELNYGYALIPIINFSLLLKEILIGNFHTGHFLVVISSTLLIAVAGLWASINLFKKESVLFRTEEGKSLKFWGSGKKNIFSPGFAFAIFLLILLLFYYLGSSWQSKDLVAGLIKTEILLVLLPVIILYRISKTSIKDAARLVKTPLLNFILAIFAAFPALIITISSMQLVNFLYPLPENYLEGMQKLMVLNDLPLPLLLLIIGILPGICEEMLFRGYLIRAFEKSGIWKAVLISGLLFGIFHLDFFRLLPTTLMGIWLGYLLLKTKSIFVPVIAHALHNSSTVLISQWGENIPLIKNILITDMVPAWLLILSMAILYCIALAIHGYNKEDKDSDALPG
jgi:sodium transport system permease protein